MRALKDKAEDYTLTEKLKADLHSLAEKRKPLFLTREDLEPIFEWKLRGQYGRVRGHLKKNTDPAFQAITQAALSMEESDGELEAHLRLGVLTALHGVGVPVASAILALTEPKRYCVIDFRGWRAMFGQERREFDIPAYLRYLAAVKSLAQSLGWSVQETDLAVCEYDRQRNKQASLAAPNATSFQGAG